jgi:hypothetical protein
MPHSEIIKVMEGWIHCALSGVSASRESEQWNWKRNGDLDGTEELLKFETFTCEDAWELGKILLPMQWTMT